MSIRINTAKFDAAFKRFSALSKKSCIELVTQQAKLFVRDAVSVTPPNTGKISEGKKRGEAAILGDMMGGRTTNLGGFRVLTRGFFIINDNNGVEYDEIVSLFTNKAGEIYGVEKNLYRPNASVDELMEHRKKYRSTKTGRMSGAGLRTRDVGRRKFVDRMVVGSRAVNGMLKKLYRRVGFLAGGWNATAQRLGVNLPAWIRRHGTGHGSVRINTSAFRFSIKMENNVPYADGVRGLKRRVQWALDKRAEAMMRRVDHYVLKQNARKAGFKS